MIDKDTIRECLTCHVEKPLSAYPIKDRGKMGYGRHCKDCTNKAARELTVKRREARGQMDTSEECYKRFLDTNKDFSVERIPTKAGGTYVAFGSKYKPQPTPRKDGTRSPSGVQSGMKLFEIA